MLVTAGYIEFYNVVNYTCKGKGRHRNVTIGEQKERTSIAFVTLSLGKGSHCRPVEEAGSMTKFSVQ